ncbi:MAG TPA: phosphonate ABC transporter ATP-binding protein [Burkholderiales bacterium]|nr:phosphonate ABC transporter ATP-binding protein [Burkholderiales bacterium]
MAALREVSLDVPAGQLCVVLGPSGAGKSTLLRCINRLVEPDAGEIRLDGRAVTADRHALREARRHLGMVFQGHNLVPRLSVMKNVLVGRLGAMPRTASLLQRFADADIEAAAACLRRVELEHKAWERADRLSGGQQQRVGIARALAQEPRAILADEPVSSLDPKTSRLVLGDLRRAAHDLGIAVLCNLHQVDYAVEFADRVVGIAAGRIVFDGAPARLDRAALRGIYPGLDDEAFA